MNETELQALSGAIVAPGRQQRMKALLRKNTRGELGEAERRELDALLDEADRLALLKAKAAYTLAQLGVGRAQALVRRYIPVDRRLSEELIAERRNDVRGG
jgi:hypothetical protein